MSEIHKVGILGGGQLARMMALAGIPLGLQFRFLDPAADACAAPLGSLIQAVLDRTKTVGLKQVNHVLVQPHWRKDHDLAQG